MTTNNKKALIFGGAIIVGSAIAFWIFSAKKNKLPLVDGGRVTEDETPTPEDTKPNRFSTYFASVLQNNPFPKDIDYKFGSTIKL